MEQYCEHTTSAAAYEKICNLRDPGAHDSNSCVWVQTPKSCVASSALPPRAGDSSSPPSVVACENRARRLGRRCGPILRDDASPTLDGDLSSGALAGLLGGEVVSGAVRFMLLTRQSSFLHESSTSLTRLQA